MSHTSRPAFSRARGPRGHREQSQACSHPPGGMAELSTGPGDAAESVIDPDMVALFKEFLGEETLSEGPSLETQSLAKPYHYVVRDTQQKGLYLHDGQLVATSLQGANAAQEEPISVVPNRHLERWRCPLFVGIRGGSQALSCGTGPEPQLKLEEVGLLELFSREDKATPYTFYKTFSGSTHTFEAAAFPGRFLSTAPEPGEALRLAAPPAITNFYLRRK
ncbi:interleukin-36 receptor antagonist protein-like [Grus americana]|uniref:interleukin-36 receptor antagonist protein-like n=1 Tax=Grus americana TaxID=9117 RepID=UPI0024080A09|nr:interleukin-36 receptor antagonist protein-like [Grus americana]